MNQLESTIQNITPGLAPGTSPIADDFLPSLYRITLILGMLVTVGIAGLTRSSIWAGSFFFGVIASLAFLKAQEVFLKRMLAGNAVQPADAKATKTPKSIWVIMAGKYFVLAGIMAAALHFHVLNLIAFVFGFAMLHLVMVAKVVINRNKSRSEYNETVTTDAAHHHTA